MEDKKIVLKIDNEEKERRRHKVLRDQGMTINEFQGLTKEEKLAHAKRWEGRTKEFDDAHEYQFSYREFCNCLMEYGIVNVSYKGWVYVAEFDKHQEQKHVSSNEVQTLYVDMSKDFKNTGRTVHVSKSTFERWDKRYQKSGMKSRILDAVLNDYLDKIENGKIKVMANIS